jgi:hypothetical protein
MKKVLLVLLLMCTSLVGKASVIDGGYLSPVYDPGSITKSYTFHLSDQMEVSVYLSVCSYNVYVEIESMSENGESAMLNATGSIIVDGSVDIPLYFGAGGLECLLDGSGYNVDLFGCGVFYASEFAFEDVARSWASARIYLSFHDYNSAVTPQDFYFTSFIVHDGNSMEGNWDACAGTY